MLNFVVRVFGLCIKYFGVLGILVALSDADLAGVLAVFLVFYLPGNYLSKAGVTKSQPNNNTGTSIVSSYPIGYLGSADVYSDKLILRYWTSKIIIDIDDIRGIEKLGFFDSIVGRNIKIMTNQKIHYISTSSAVPIIESIENARMNLRYSRPNSIQQNVVQNIVQGDTITKTEIKDSVINRSNLGNNEDDKVAKIEKISEMKEKGLISDEEFEKMKKDIIG